MKWLLLMALLAGCGHMAPDPCEDWDWLDHEGCSGDVCAQEPGAESYECRDGVCWCCSDDDCWEG